METFFFEILSEEIPARMQQDACESLDSLLRKELENERLSFSSIETYTSPRRLVGVVTGLPLRQEGRNLEVRGPRIDASSQALEGFLKSQGLSSLDACVQQESPKGRFWVHSFLEKEKKTSDILGPLLGRILKDFPWKKSMRWGANFSISWVRPVRGILALFGDSIVPFTLGEGPWEIRSSNQTRGHRFLSPQPFEVSSFEMYKKELKERYVLLENKARKETLWQAALVCAKEKNLEIIKDPGLLEEVTGLVEWPTPLLGKIPQEYMSLPQDVLITSMRKHQRYFSLKSPFEEGLAPFFLVVANGIFEKTSPETIVKGNEHVLNARLSDALFFWESDKKIPLEEMAHKLKMRVFQDKLGTLYDKAERLKDLCQDTLGGILLKSVEKKIDGPTLKSFGRAAFLAKADLVSSMVGEFPELQGIMGHAYALEQNELPQIADALKEHYAPLGSEGDVPRAPLSVAVALADRMDTLVGFFGLGIFPTGSKDPYALRRAALSILRILEENKLQISLEILMKAAFEAYEKQGYAENFKSFQEVSSKLMEFFEERLKVNLRESYAPGSVGAALHKGWEENIPETLALVAAIDNFMQTKQGGDLLRVYRRANNILKDMVFDASHILNPNLLEDFAEKALWESVQEVSKKLQKTGQDFKTIFLILGEITPALDSFFEKVRVNVEDVSLREVRCLLIHKVVEVFEQVADFSKIEKESGGA